LQHVAGVGTIVIASGIPLWFCIACPTVLGFALPLLANVACYWIALRICKAFGVPEDKEVVVLWASVLVALVLSLASAWPIYVFCRLPECAQRAGLF